MKGNAGNKTQSNIYMHVNQQLKSRVRVGKFCSPKNTKNTPQIITEGKRKETGIEESPNVTEVAPHGGN